MEPTDNPSGEVKDLGDSLFYSRCKFSTALPKQHRYTAGHFWLTMQEPDLWRVGFTKFAVRMLGDFVELQIDAKPGDSVRVADVIGWYEGMKALTDLLCVLDGVFERGNPALAEDGELTRTDPHDKGWLYEVRGTPDAGSVDVNGYIAALDATIDRMQEDDPA